MSTKIYNGYRLPVMDVQTLQKFLIRYKNLVNVERNKLYYSFLVNRAVESIDNIKFEIKHWNETKIKNGQIEPYWDAYNYVDDAAHEIKIKGIRNPPCDFECQVAIIPIKDKILALLYTERNEFIAIWENILNVEEYGYWNNVDPLESVTAEQWKQRENDWDRAMPSGVPAETCLTFDPFVRLPEYNINESLKYIPTDEKRSQRITNEILWLEHIKNKLDTTDVSYYYDYRESISTGGSKRQLFLDKVEEIKLKLVKIDKTILTNKIDIPEHLKIKNENT